MTCWFSHGCSDLYIRWTLSEIDRFNEELSETNVTYENVWRRLLDLRAGVILLFGRDCPPFVYGREEDLVHDFLAPAVTPYLVVNLEFGHTPLRINCRTLSLQRYCHRLHDLAFRRC